MFSNTFTNLAVVACAMSCITSINAKTTTKSSSKTSSWTTSKTSSTSQASATPTCLTFVDTFDNYTTIPGAPEANPVSFDGGLYYSVFVVNPGKVDGTGFNVPSFPNIAAVSVPGVLVSTQIVTLNPFGSISTAGTSTKSFTLVEFYFSCDELSDNSAATLTPIGCGIEVSGYDTSGMQIGSASYNYAPETPVLASMSRVVLPSRFTNLKNVTFAVATSSTTTASTVLFVDSVKHVNCY